MVKELLYLVKRHQFKFLAAVAAQMASLWKRLRNNYQRTIEFTLGYNIHDIPGSVKSQKAENESRFWYQYYSHSERGRELFEKLRELCRTGFCRPRIHDLHHAYWKREILGNSDFSIAVPPYPHSPG